MFKLFGKKNKEPKPLKHKKGSKSNQTPVVEPAIEFSPVFNFADNFIATYCNKEPSVPVGKYNGREIDVAIGALKCNDILVVNNNENAICEKHIAPMLKRGGASYILYDKTGKYYEQFAPMMKSNGYDVQLIDFTDESNPSRIDIFEVLNTIKNPYWLSIIISSSIKCNAQELKVAHNLFMAMFEYLFSGTEAVDFVTLYGLFNNIRNKDMNTLNAIIQCEKARKFMMLLTKSEQSVIRSTYEKADNLFFKNVFAKVKEPNIYTMATHQKKTVFFVKPVPARYKVLSTILMMNIKTANVICGYGKPSTVLVKFKGESWYHEALLDKVCDDVGNMSNSVAELTFSDTVGDATYRSTHGKQLIVFERTDDKLTKEFIIEQTKIKNWSKDGQMFISDGYFDGKPIPAYALEASPLTYNELDTLNDCIVIEPCDVSDPFRCDYLI